MGTASRIVFFASCPDAVPPLWLDEEARAIAGKLHQSSLGQSLELISCWATRPGDLLSELNRYRPSVLHISGHGNADGDLVLMDDARRPVTVSARTLRDVLRALGDPVHLVVLNGCYTATRAATIAEAVDCVVGMAGPVDDDAAVAFAANFYQAIGFGRSVRDAFAQAQVALPLLGLGEGREPVLTTRAGVDPATVFPHRGPHPGQQSGTADVGPLETRTRDPLAAYCRAVTVELAAWRGLGAVTAKDTEHLYVAHRLLRGATQLTDDEAFARLTAGGPAAGGQGDRAPALLVEGNPGSGKSMLLHHWTQELAYARLRDPAHALVPLLVPLAWWERTSGPGPWTSSPAALLARRYASDAPGEEEALAYALGEALRDGRAVLLLDALDELSDPAMVSLRDWWGWLRAHYPAAPVAITGRPLVEAGGIAVGERLYVRAFDAGQQGEFVRRWFGDGQELAAEALLKTLAGRRRLHSAQIAGNPLFLTLMCVEYESRGELSTTAGGLLDRFVRLLLERWDKERGVRHRAVPVDLALRVLEAVAVAALDQDLARLKERWLLGIVAEVLAAAGGERGGGVEHSPADLLADIVESSGLLRRDAESGADYVFCHALFVDYFAARAQAFGAAPDHGLGWLTERFADPRYEGAVRFYQELIGQG